MSKASEWAANPTWPRHDLVLHGARYLRAYPVLYSTGVRYAITRPGEGSFLLERDEALTLARHILDTFSDEPRAAAGSEGTAP